MNKQDIETLRRLISSMDLPDWRKTQDTPHNLRWIARNMGIRNSGHPNYQEARQILARLLREEENAVS